MWFARRKSRTVSTTPLDKGFTTLFLSRRHDRRESIDQSLARMKPAEDGGRMGLLGR